AAVQPPEAGVGVPVRDRVLHDVAVTAMQLHAAVDDGPEQLRAVKLQRRGASRRQRSIERLADPEIEERLRRLEVGGRLTQQLARVLKRRDRLAERLAVKHVL